MGITGSKEENLEIPAFLRKKNNENYSDEDFKKNIPMEFDKEYANLVGENELLKSRIKDIERNFEIKILNIKKNDEDERRRLEKDFENQIEFLKEDYLKRNIEIESQYSSLIQKRIDDNLTNYVTLAVDELKGIQKKLKFSAGVWSFISGVIVLSTLVVGIAFSLLGYYFGPSINDLNWPELLIVSLKGIFLISALVAAANIAFKKSNSYTHEAITVANRAHAIHFGKLYLEIYGNTVERSEMVKIFENWNLSSETAFIDLNKNKNINDREEAEVYRGMIKDLISVFKK